MTGGEYVWRFDRLDWSAVTVLGIGPERRHSLGAFVMPAARGGYTPGGAQ